MTLSLRFIGYPHYRGSCFLILLICLPLPNTFLQNSSPPIPMQSVSSAGSRFISTEAPPPMYQSCMRQPIKTGIHIYFSGSVGKISKYEKVTEEDEHVNSPSPFN